MNELEITHNQGPLVSENAGRAQPDSVPDIVRIP